VTHEWMRVLMITCNDAIFGDGGGYGAMVSRDMYASHQLKFVAAEEKW
jgi:hypothetical protein